MSGPVTLAGTGFKTAGARKRRGTADAAAEGATQFAGYPHEDYIVREFQWQEPDGRFLSMRMNFDKRLEHLRTIRDHSRENYDRALRATRDRLFPLTPTDFQTFGNAAGGGFGARRTTNSRCFVFWVSMCRR